MSSSRRSKTLVSTILYSRYTLSTNEYVVFRTVYINFVLMYSLPSVAVICDGTVHVMDATNSPN